jgi:23S rRNA pseudouridine1911/1915/1917 synthase
VDEVAREWLTGVLGAPPARAAVRRLLMAGALRADGRPLRAPGRVLHAGVGLVLHLRPELVHRAPAADGAWPVRIVYEDDALVVVDKPPGLPTVATADPRRPHLVGVVTALLRSRGAAPPGPLGVHQRLDRDTSGLVLLVKDPAANADLAAQFAGRAVEKTYLALTARPRSRPPRTWRADESVERAEAGKAARPALTDFALVEAWPGGLLVEARPRTGRKHQIRIHLARAGLPILGDAAYGGDPRAAPRVMLHAARLQLRHPLTGARLDLSSPPPADFRGVLDRLRRAPPRSPRDGARRRR